MKLTEIRIDCRGMWNNLTLPLRPQGLSVIYGPNEAGKTTLREFITKALFPASGNDEQAPQPPARLAAAGSLLIEDAAGNHRIPGGATASPNADAAATVLENSLKGIDAHLFEQIFAVGLRELMDVSALSGDELSRHLFGLSLGPTGVRILDAARRVDERRARLIDPLQKEGELIRLFERHDQLTARLAELAQLQERHAEWSRRRDQLEGEIADLRKRRSGTSEQLRGHEYLERAWGPWDRIRDCRRELAGLPEIADFPERGLERLERIENEIAAAAEERDRLLAEVRQRRDEAVPAAESALWREHVSAVRGFVAQHDWLAGLNERRHHAGENAAARQLEFEEPSAPLSGGWSAERVAAVDISAAARRRLSGTAESFLAALARRKMIRRKRRRLVETCRDLKESLTESLHDLGGRSIDAALSEARERVAGLSRQATLKLKEVELAQRLAGLEQHRARVAPQLALPRWVYVVLGVFAFMGVILAGWGLVAGVATSGIAGGIYAMLGITCGGLAWGLKIQFEGEARARLAEVEEEITATSSELATIRESIRQAGGGQSREGWPGLDQREAPTSVSGSSLNERPTSGDSASPASAASPNSSQMATDQASPVYAPAELICQAQNQIAALVDMAASQRRLRAIKQKYVACRKKLETAEREIATARHNWSEVLSSIGLPQTLSIDEALAAWQLLVDAAERLIAWKQADRELQTLNGIWDDYRQRIADLARRLPASGNTAHDPLELLAAWREKIADLDGQQSDRRNLRDELRQKQREARQLNKRVEAIKLKRNALLVQGGAAGRDEFEDRSRSFARRTFLEDQLHDAQNDLDAACSDHSDLALAEEDLERFDPRQNSECIETLRMELADLERDLERAFEHLGGVKREIESLENDTQGTKVRYELRQVEDELRTLAREWAVYESAAVTIDDIRRDFERTHQPQALVEAARLFERMTRGRYRNIWTPLGEKRLIVDDDQGRSFPVQSLSRGTREQLLLAVRLAVVRKLSAEGISLPVILDDVIVNFDEDRATATAELLVELAGQGLQVLYFTCHKHLAHLFASRGIEPVWLPMPAAATSEEKRLAG